MKNTIKKCENCGGNLKFSPQKQNLFCEHCDNEQEIEKISYQTANKQALNLSQTLEDINVEFNCPNCGAINEMGNQYYAYVCSHCETPIVLKKYINNIDAVLPFQISKQKAQEEYKKWLNKNFWAPRSLKKIANLGLIKGFYVPVWSFDANTQTKFSGVEVIEHTHTRYVNGKPQTYTTTTRHNFSGTRKDDFYDLFVAGNNKILNSTLTKLEPFDVSCLNIYNPDYLFGYFSDAFSVSISTSYKTAQSRMENNIRAKIIASKSNRVENLKTDISFMNPKSARYLLPIWKLDYDFKGKKYDVAINGCTGEVKGDAPISKWKVLLTVLASIGLIIGIIILCAYFN